MSEGNYFVIGDIKKGNYGHRVRQSIIAKLAKRKGLTQPNVLYIGAASDNNPRFESGFAGGIKRVLPGSIIQSLRLFLDQDDTDFDSCSVEIAPVFETADIIYFESGDVAPLKETFDKFRLKAYCRQAYERGALVGGMCGGGSFLAEQVVHYDTQSRDFTRELGASLLSGCAVSCHMDRPDEYDPRHRQLRNIASSGMMRAIGLGANQAVVFNAKGEYALCPGSEMTGDAPPFYVDINGSNQPMLVRHI